MNWKKAVRKVHLWLGLVSGIVVFIVAITGALYAFQAEISAWLQPYDAPTASSNASALPPSELREAAQAAYPEGHLHSIGYMPQDHVLEAVFWQPEPRFYKAAYLDVYTGEVLHREDRTKNFFWIILQGHYYLWLPPVIGQPIVAYSTLIFVLMGITGLFLWWPKNRAARKQRTGFRWKSTTKWRRKNFDLHTVLGFYTLAFSLLFAITGLVWGLPYFAQACYSLMGGEKSLEYYEPTVEIPVDQPELDIDNQLDQVYVSMMKQFPDAYLIDLHLPETDSSTIYVLIQHDPDTYWRNDFYYFNPYTLEAVYTDNIYADHRQAAPADRIMRMNYDIHVGSILGFPGKVIAFLASLVIASLPVTGITIYLGRKRKKKKR